MNIELAKLIISICALVVSVLTLCGFGVYMSFHTKKRLEKKEAARRVEEERREQEKNEALMTLINKSLDAKLTPIAADVATIKSNLSLNTEGTVTLLRNDMKKSLDWYKDRGFATANDKAAWMELYNTYGRLGGNHFREYVDGWKEEVRDLPVEKKKTRQRLTESTKSSKK